MSKPKVLLIHTGGTLSQERGGDGVFRPSEKNYLDLVERINDIADITFEKTANIDSSNMETKHRAMLAQKVYDNHLRYSGFVIVHGTDTMVDSAAAINYMLQGLGKPIVFTGSQKSIFEPGSDAQNNLYYAVKAATLDLGEVVIAFGDRIVRGNRSLKISEQGLNAFDSPRVSPVGEIGIDIILADHRISKYNGDPVVFTDFDTNIELYQQSSGTNTTIFKKYVDDKDIHGIVVGAYGAGNVQERLVPYIKEATQKGKPVLVVTSCILGAADMGIYETGAEPLKAGAISAGDLTTEAAIQKLMYAVGRANKSNYEEKEKLDFVQTLIQRDYAKDMTTNQNRFV